MSVKTIKGTRQKIATGSYADYVPFGADGEYVDMMSGLNLERELKLGGDHLTSIVQRNGQTVVTEKYAKASVTTNFYKVVTTIAESNGSTTITSVLYWVNESGRDIVKKTKTITIADTGTGTNISEVLS